jgi:hypothetical protein
MFSGMIQILVLFVETPCKFITAKLSIHKPGSSSVVINLCDVSTNKIIIIVLIMFYRHANIQRTYDPDC